MTFSLLSLDWICFHSSSTSLPDCFQGCTESFFRHAFPSVVLVNEEASYPPRIFIILAFVASHSIDTRQFVLGTELAPPNRYLVLVDQDSMCSSFINELFLFLLVLFARSSAPTARHLVEHAPASCPHSSVLLKQLHKVRPSRTREFLRTQN